MNGNTINSSSTHGGTSVRSITVEPLLKGPPN